MPTKSSSIVRAFAAAALVGSLAVAVPAHAKGWGSSSSSSSKSASDASYSAKKKAETPEERQQRVENRIQTLHDKLKITPEQESAWNEVAQAMRDNESGIEEQIQARRENASDMTAVQDLQSYQKIAQAHADGMDKVISKFSSLYDDMSDEQKKNADQVFGQFEGHRGLSKASASPSKKSGSSSSSSDSE